MASNFKRTRLWVDPEIQSRLLMRLGVYQVVFALMLVHVGFAIEVIQHLVQGEGSTMAGSQYLDYLRQQKSILVALVLLTPVLFYDLLKFSHRIVGPLVRCRRVMLEMAAGKRVEAFRPRKHDLLREFFEAFNVLIQARNTETGVEAVPRWAEALQAPALESSPAEQADQGPPPNPVSKL